MFTVLDLTLSLKFSIISNPIKFYIAAYNNDSPNNVIGFFTV